MLTTIFNAILSPHKIIDKCKGRDTPDAKPQSDTIFVISDANKFVPHEKLDKITMTG